MRVIIDVPDNETLIGWYTRFDGINQYHNAKTLGKPNYITPLDDTVSTRNDVLKDMTREEAIKVLSDIDHAWRNFTKEEYVALEMAMQALSKVNDIKAIINNPMYIQEDVLRYQMICEVVKE